MNKARIEELVNEAMKERDGINGNRPRDILFNMLETCVRETREECANWHEEMAKKWDAKGDIGSMTEVRAYEHRHYAAAIRALEGE